MSSLIGRDSSAYLTCQFTLKARIRLRTWDSQPLIVPRRIMNQMDSFHVICTWKMPA